jgi:hypothetical protein
MRARDDGIAIEAFEVFRRRSPLNGRLPRGEPLIPSRYLSRRRLEDRRFLSAWPWCTTPSLVRTAIACALGAVIPRSGLRFAPDNGTHCGSGGCN